MLWSSWSYNKGGSEKVAICYDHQKVITKEEVEKLRYLMIIIKLYERKKWKSSGMYSSSWSYQKRGKGKVAICNDLHEVKTKEEVEKLRYVMVIMKL